MGCHAFKFHLTVVLRPKEHKGFTLHFQDVGLLKELLLG
jgi:hypothetical protein